MSRPNCKNILDIEFYSRDLSEDLTIREYFKRLLTTLWQQAEGFSGKRPFGNGSWQYEVYAALIRGKAIEGELDDHGSVEKIDTIKGDELIIEAIRNM